MDAFRYQAQYTVNTHRMKKLIPLVSMLIVGIILGMVFFSKNKYVQAQMTMAMQSPNMERMVYKDKDRIVYQFATNTTTCYRVIKIADSKEEFNCN